MPINVPMTEMPIVWSRGTNSERQNSRLKSGGNISPMKRETRVNTPEPARAILKRPVA